MGVALEEALLEDHAGVQAADATRHLTQVVAGGPQLVEVSHLDALEVLEHPAEQNFRCGPGWSLMAELPWRAAASRGRPRMDLLL